MRTFWLVCLAQVACACTPHEIRCDGRLEPINVSALTPTALRSTGPQFTPEVP